ncbi:MAG: sigma-70 family RNA polymerase sigma factor [bacterium]
MEKTDLELIKEIQESTNYLKEGRLSFNTLVARYANSVYFFIYRLTGSKEGSEDISQETFIKAWQKISKFDANKNFKTWLFTIAKNTAIDKLRKKNAVPFSVLNILDSHNDIETDFESNIMDTEDLPNEVFEKKEYFESLRIALEKLSSSENLIISLHVTEELTFEEISEITNKPMNTIKSQYRRAISKLKELLTDK